MSLLSLSSDLAAGQRAAGSPAAGQQAAGSPAAGQQATGSPASGSPASGNQATGSQATGSPAAGQQAAALEERLATAESRAKAFAFVHRIDPSDAVFAARYFVLTKLGEASLGLVWVSVGNALRREFFGRRAEGARAVEVALEHEHIEMLTTEDARWLDWLVGDEITDKIIVGILEGYTQVEMAEQLGISQAAVSKRLKAARKHLT